MKWLGMAAAEEEEVAMEEPVAVVVEAVVADGAVQTPPLWVQDVDGDSETSSSAGSCLHV